jgi:hypothetical protein
LSVGILVVLIVDDSYRIVAKSAVFGTK